MKTQTTPSRLRISPCGKTIETDDGLKLNLTVAQLNPCGSLTKNETAKIAGDMVNAYNSAPELLEALKDALQCLIRLPEKPGAYRTTCIQQAEKAIAKAKGESTK